MSEYSFEEMMDARVGGWDDCKKLVLELLKKNTKDLPEYGEMIEGNVIQEIESEDFGVITIKIKKS